MKHTTISIAMSRANPPHFETVSAYLFEHAGLLLGVHRAPGNSKLWTVSDAETGYSVTRAISRRDDAVAEAKRILDGKTPEQIEAAISKARQQIAEEIFGHKPAKVAKPRKVKRQQVRRSVVDMDEVVAAAQRDDGTGFCLACGAEQSGCEPDARGYECEACGELQVYGAEEILLREVA